MIGKLGKMKGLAQIPLMIGLLIMAIAIPAVTKLVQQSQDTRSSAAYGDCTSGGVSYATGKLMCDGSRLVVCVGNNATQYTGTDCAVSNKTCQAGACVSPPATGSCTMTDSQISGDNGVHANGSTWCGTFGSAKSVRGCSSGAVSTLGLCTGTSSDHSSCKSLCGVSVSTCKTSCPSGSAHISGDNSTCPTGQHKTSTCTNINVGVAGCNDLYTCCDCVADAPKVDTCSSAYTGGKCVYVSSGGCGTGTVHRDDHNCTSINNSDYQCCEPKAAGPVCPVTGFGDGQVGCYAPENNNTIKTCVGFTTKYSSTTGTVYTPVSGTCSGDAACCLRKEVVKVDGKCDPTVFKLPSAPVVGSITGCTYGKVASVVPNTTDGNGTGWKWNCQGVGVGALSPLCYADIQCGTGYHAKGTICEADAVTTDACKKPGAGNLGKCTNGAVCGSETCYCFEGALPNETNSGDLSTRTCSIATSRAASLCHNLNKCTDGTVCGQKNSSADKQCNCAGTIYSSGRTCSLDLVSPSLIAPTLKEALLVTSGMQISGSVKCTGCDHMAAFLTNGVGTTTSVALSETSSGIFTLASRTVVAGTYKATMRGCSIPTNNATYNNTCPPISLTTLDSNSVTVSTTTISLCNQCKANAAANNGNILCKSKTNGLDISTWISEFSFVSSVNKDTWLSDMDCNGVVDSLDLSSIISKFSF